MSTDSTKAQLHCSITDHRFYNAMRRVMGKGIKGGGRGGESKATQFFTPLVCPLIEV